MGDTGAKMTSRHQAVVDRLRTRIGQYRKHHLDVQSKYESSLPAMEKKDRHQAMVLQQRVLVDRERKLLKGKQQDGEIKPEQPPNGVDTKSTNAILQVKHYISTVDSFIFFQFDRSKLCVWSHVLLLTALIV